MVRSVDLMGIKAVYGGIVTHLPDTAVLVTPSQQWAYAAELSLDLQSSENTEAVIRIRLAVPRGTIGIGWLRHDEKDWVCEVSASALLTQEVELIVPTDAFGGKLVFVNWTEGGKPAVGIVESIQIGAVKAPPTEATDALSLC